MQLQRLVAGKYTCNIQQQKKYSFYKGTHLTLTLDLNAQSALVKH